MKTNNHYQLGDNCSKCQKGYLELSTKKKRKPKKDQTYYFNQVLLCNRCKAVFLNECDKVYFGSERDLEIKKEEEENKPQSNQLNLF